MPMDVTYLEDLQFQFAFQLLYTIFYLTFPRYNYPEEDATLEIARNDGTLDDHEETYVDLPKLWYVCSFVLYTMQ